MIDTSCLRCRISTSFQGAITLRAHTEMDTVFKSCTHVWQNSRNASVHFGTAHCLQPQSDCICSFVVTNTRECTVAGIISLQVRTDLCLVGAAGACQRFGLADGTRAGPLKQKKGLTHSRVPRSPRLVVLVQNERPRSGTSVLVRTTSVSEKPGHNYSVLKIQYPICFLWQRHTMRILWACAYLQF